MVLSARIEADFEIPRTRHHEPNILDAVAIAAEAFDFDGRGAVPMATHIHPDIDLQILKVS